MLLSILSYIVAVCANQGATVHSITHQGVDVPMYFNFDRPAPGTAEGDFFGTGSVNVQFTGTQCRNGQKIYSGGMKVWTDDATGNTNCGNTGAGDVDMCGRCDPRQEGRCTWAIGDIMKYGDVDCEYSAPGCDDLNSWDGNSCYTRLTDFDGVTIEKSSTMSGSDSSWIQAFSSDQYARLVHMDSASIGHYLAMTFPTAQTFNGFRFECGGNGDSRNIQQNVFDVQYHDGSDWVTVGTTNTANGICGPLDSSGYATWPAVYSSTQWRFILTEQHGGPWYHGFSWYIGSDPLTQCQNQENSDKFVDHLEEIYCLCDEYLSDGGYQADDEGALSTRLVDRIESLKQMDTSSASGTKFLNSWNFFVDKKLYFHENANGTKTGKYFNRRMWRKVCKFAKVKRTKMRRWANKLDAINGN